jgi:hypothetical protein
LAVTIGLGLDMEWETSAIVYLVLSLNVVIIGTLSYLLYPILLVERCSVASSASRSIRQVRPHFWRIAALTMIFWLAYIAGSAIVTVVMHRVEESVANWAYYAIWGPWIVILVVAGNVLPAVVYQLLRIEREGPDPTHVAGVFE